jgi:hypothetical protein
MRVKTIFAPSGDQPGPDAILLLMLILRGLPPIACKRAERETAGRLRSRPVERS